MALEQSPNQNAPKPPRFAWWRLRIKNGVSNAGDEELEKGIVSLEDFEIFCAAVVVAGILIEFFLAYLQLPFESRLQRNGTTLADAYVALGIVGEVLAGVRIKLFQGELTKRSNDKVAEAKRESASALGLAASAAEDAANAQAEAAEALENLATATGVAAMAQQAAGQANERAAKADLETERVRLDFGWRAVASEQMFKLIGELSKTTGQVCISFPAGDHESESYAHQFMFAFQNAGWPGILRTCTYSRLLYGLNAPELSDGRATTSKLIRDALGAAGIGFSGELPQHFGMSQTWTFAPPGYQFTQGWFDHDKAGLLYVCAKRMPWATDAEEWKKIEVAHAKDNK